MDVVLPPPDPPFPIKDRFRIQADLYPLGTRINGRLERANFVEDELYFTYLARKLELLEADAAKRRAMRQDDPAGLANALWRIFALLARDEPQVVSVSEGEIDLMLHGIRLAVTTTDQRLSPVIVRSSPTLLGVQIADWLERQQGVFRLADALALSCQEDIVVMRGTREAHLSEMVHVCFPSQWDPRKKVDASYNVIHGPIPRNRLLTQAGGKVMDALLTKGPFIRYGWALTLIPELDLHPETSLPGIPSDLLAYPDRLAASTYLRMERQTTYPMPELQRGLFCIHTYMQPLPEAVQDPRRRAKLASILRTLEPDVAAFKGLTELRQPLLHWLDR